MGLRAGTLRHQITLQARETTRDPVGGQSTAWTDVATVWASLEPSVGRELMAAQALAIDQPTTITVRYQSFLADPRLVVAMRALYGTRIFNIHSSQNETERNRSVTLIASEGMNDG